MGGGNYLLTNNLHQHPTPECTHRSQAFRWGASGFGRDGYYWSSTIAPNFSSRVYSLKFNVMYAYADCLYTYRPDAKSVRCVSGEGDNSSTESSYGHAGTLEDPFTVEDAIVYTSSLAADEENATDVYIKGVVTSIKEVFGSYGNATFYIGDSAEATQTFYVYRVYKDETLTVSATNGKKVLGVEFTCIAKGYNKYGPGCFTTGSGYTFADEVGTWASEEEGVVFTASSNQVRAIKIVITFSK